MTKKKKDQDIDSVLNALDYFVAGVPPGPLFRMGLNDLNEVVDKSKDKTLNTAAEVCVIASVAYFEAFFKHEFACLINICPELVADFTSVRPEDDVVISAADLIEHGYDLRSQLGFLIAEKYDFGTPKKINSLFHDLILLTPFNQKEARLYNQVLNNRNLLAHHHGILTMKYYKQNRQRFKPREIEGRRVFYDSLTILKKHFFDQADFLENMVKKTTENSYKRLNAFVQEKDLKLSKDRKDALDFVRYYDL